MNTMLKSAAIACFLLLCTSLYANAQVVAMQQLSDTAFKTERVISGEFTDFTVDNLGNLYVSQPDRAIEKNEPEGRFNGCFQQCTPVWKDPFHRREQSPESIAALQRFQHHRDPRPLPQYPQHHRPAEEPTVPGESRSGNLTIIIFGPSMKWKAN